MVRQPFLFYALYKLYNKSYFEAHRSSRNRSLLSVNEDFENEQDVEIALSDSLALEEEAGVDIERTVTILILNQLILAELAYWQTILEGHDEVLVHNKA